MIVTEDFLFIHVPKTGGMSVTDLLLDAIDKQNKPITVYSPEQQSKTECVCCGSKVPLNNVINVEGIRHENLEEARIILAQNGIDIFELKNILAVIRNPYALEVSIYGYLKKGYAHDAGPQQEAAINGTFNDYIKINDWHYDRRKNFKFEKFYTLDREIPKNLTIIRYETLENSLRNFMIDKLAVPPRKRLPTHNASEHLYYSSYLTKESEQLIYKRYKWVFDNGFYNREIPKG